MNKRPDRYTDDGREIMDPTPMQPPLGYRRTPTLAEQIRAQVMRMKAELLENDAIQETDEEADDFQVGDDFEPISPHENDHVPSIKELKKRAQEINAKIKNANRLKAIADYEKEQAAKSPPKPAADENRNS